MNLEVVQEQSEILEIDYDNNRKIIENQFFDEEGNIFNSMLISFVSGISSIRGTPLNAEKLNLQPSNKNSPYCGLNVRTPTDKKKLFGNLQQTSSSLHRKAQAMNKPMHSNRKLFDGDEVTKPIHTKKASPRVMLVDKENNDKNGSFQNQLPGSPIPSIKGTWNKHVSPMGHDKLSNIRKSNNAVYKSPFVLRPQNENSKLAPQFATPLNGFKGSLVAPST